jgi:hypothetical protein
MPIETEYTIENAAVTRRNLEPANMGDKSPLFDNVNMSLVLAKRYLNISLYRSPSIDE